MLAGCARTSSARRASGNTSSRSCRAAFGSSSRLQPGCDGKRSAGRWSGRYTRPWQHSMQPRRSWTCKSSTTSSAPAPAPRKSWSRPCGRRNPVPATTAHLPRAVIARQCGGSLANQSASARGDAQPGRVSRPQLHDGREDLLYLRVRLGTLSAAARRRSAPAMTSVSTRSTPARQRHETLKCDHMSCSGAL